MPRSVHEIATVSSVGGAVGINVMPPASRSQARDESAPASGAGDDRPTRGIHGNRARSGRTSLRIGKRSAPDPEVARPIAIGSKGVDEKRVWALGKTARMSHQDLPLRAQRDAVQRAVLRPLLEA